MTKLEQLKDKVERAWDISVHFYSAWKDAKCELAIEVYRLEALEKTRNEKKFIRYGKTFYETHTRGGVSYKDIAKNVGIKYITVKDAVKKYLNQAGIEEENPMQSYLSAHPAGTLEWFNRGKYLSEQIDSNQNTLRGLAKMYGVSPATISRIINIKYKKQEITREAIEKKIGRPYKFKWEVGEDD